MGLKTRNRIWEHSNQTSSDLLLLLAIAEYANDDGVCWPGIPTLAEKARCSERQAQRNIEKLEKRGELFIAHKRGRGNSNLYFITAGLSQDEISSVLKITFEIPEDEANSTACNILNLQLIAKKPVTDDVFSNEEKVTSRAKKPDTGDVKPDIQDRKGDIAMSPEPIEPSCEPSFKLERDARALTSQVLETCGYSLEYLSTATARQLNNATTQLTEWKATPELVKEFRASYWWGSSPPTINQLINDWSKFMTWKRNPDKGKRDRGRPNGHKPTKQPEPKSTTPIDPEEQARLKRMYDAVQARANEP